MENAGSGRNREHLDHTGHGCPIEKHGAVTAMVGGVGPGYITAHADGTVLASINGTRQRQPYRFGPSRNGDALRSRERGGPGERARAAINWAGWEVVEHDRRGRDPGHGMTDQERTSAAAEMTAEVQRLRECGLNDPTAEAARLLSRRPGHLWGRTTYLDCYRASMRTPQPHDRADVPSAKRVEVRMNGEVITLTGTVDANTAGERVLRLDDESISRVCATQSKDQRRDQ